MPPDLINFQHDPLACAVALGWEEGLEFEELPLLAEEKDGWLVQRIHPDGNVLRVATRVDGPRFSQYWLDQVTGAPSPRPPRAAA